tara:strand:+ start:210 stop:548 length:339 start_codon:yes stop_codon:yes gene_type:complete
MAVTWNIVSLDVTKTEGSLSDVIQTAHWVASETEIIVDGLNETIYEGIQYGSVGLPAANSSSFIAYGSVTKANVIEWVKAILGTEEVTKIEQDVTTQFTESKTPTRTVGVPW